MADTKELGAAPEDTTFEPTTSDTFNLPQGWMYRQRKIGSIVLPWYASPKVQLLMVSMVCFLCPGMFNALGGLGGGGKADATLADNMASPSPSVPRSNTCSALCTPVRKKWIQFPTYSMNQKHVVLIHLPERSPLQHLRGDRFLRRHLREPARRQDNSLLRRARLLHLRHQSPG